MKCLYCKHKFTSIRPNHVLCSYRCRVAYWNEKKNAERRVRHKKRRCKICGHWFQPIHSTAKYCGKQCQQFGSRPFRRVALKLRAIEYLGGKCVVCGYNRCAAALDFHHRNPHRKDKAIVNNIADWKWSDLKRELDKCDLVCANCHREIHHGKEPHAHKKSNRKRTTGISMGRTRS